MNSQIMNNLTSKAERASIMLVQKYATQSNMRMVAQKFAKKFSEKIFDSLPNNKDAAEEFYSGMLTQEGLDVMEKLVQSEIQKVFN